MAHPPSSKPRLKRSLGLGILTLYGVGVIIGAGIYVLVGQVAAASGGAAPLSFLLAGLLAVPTGLSFAELSARHPEASGEAAYAHSAFKNKLLPRFIGFAVAGVGIFAAASIARGCAAYLAQLLPLLTIPLGSALIVSIFTAVACLRVANSVAAAACMTIIEIGGLVYVLAAGFTQTEAFTPAPFEFQPIAIASGAFIATFAFLGFETLANMAEESVDPGKNVPRAILLALGISTVLYVIVAYAAVRVVPLEILAHSPTPLLDVVARSRIGNVTVFSMIAMTATANGVLIEILMVSRMLYGMADRGWLPHYLAHVWPRTHAPVRTTLITGGIILVLAAPFDIGVLAVAASNLLLCVFIVTNLALMRLHRTEPRSDIAIRAPRWIPPLGVAGSAALLIAQVF